MGGSNKKENLVYLTAEEHYVAHQLLVKMYPDNKRLVYAANMMCTNSPTGQRNNKLYGWLRTKLKDGPNQFKKGHKPWNKNKKDNYSNETLSKMSKAKKGLPGHPSEKLNKTFEELYGVEKAKDIKSKCTSNGFKGKTQPQSAKDHLAKINTGKTYSKEINAKKASKRCSCLICKKETTASSLTMYHKHSDYNGTQ